MNKKNSIQYRLKYSDIKEYIFSSMVLYFFAKGFHNINEK